MSKIESSEFRQTLGTFATGVTVITAVSKSGELAGVTANSFTSVSLEPPLILWCLATSSDNLNIFRNAEYFAVNILSSEQKDVSSHFARRQPAKFAGINYESGLGGAPLLAKCLARLQCRSTESFEIGDHWVFVGEVLEYESASREALLFHMGSYAFSLPRPQDEGSVLSSINSAEHHEDSLFNLLLQAIHAYQEKFEDSQKKIIESNYEARIVMVLQNHEVVDIYDLCQMIQTPRTETINLLNGLTERGIIEIKKQDKTEIVQLTGQGIELSRKLRDIVNQQESEIYRLFNDCNAEKFRENLVKIANWTGR